MYSQARGLEGDRRLSAERNGRTSTPPMAKEEKISLEGEVTEALPDARFKVKLENDHEILAYVSGRMRKFFIRILPGDRVTVELSAYDMTKGRITYRH